MVSNKAVRQALYEKLNVASVTSLLGSGSASLVHALSGRSAAYPLCVFAKSGDTTTLRMGGNAFDTQTWFVKGVVRDFTPSVAEAIDKAARDLLDFGSLTIAGGEAMFVARISGTEYAETVDDNTYRHVVSLYRLTVQEQ